MPDFTSGMDLSLFFVQLCPACSSNWLSSYFESKDLDRGEEETGTPNQSIISTDLFLAGAGQSTIHLKADRSPSNINRERCQTKVL
ncbi:hypothetical protein MRB53_011676 [Persea americana]|uniref:Uncharacterized protein n=1 Tax=Persea americana TaxID=3435 RepID=A0ACC2LWJ0_PERAE|nr:hypothetical protein MRB53_011676 [Persea americana]